MDWPIQMTWLETAWLKPPAQTSNKSTTGCRPMNKGPEQKKGSRKQFFNSQNPKLARSLQ